MGTGHRFIISMGNGKSLPTRWSSNEIYHCRIPSHSTTWLSHQCFSQVIHHSTTCILALWKADSGHGHPLGYLVSFIVKSLVLSRNLYPLEGHFFMIFRPCRAALTFPWRYRTLGGCSVLESEETRNSTSMSRCASSIFNALPAN